MGTKAAAKTDGGNVAIDITALETVTFEITGVSPLLMNNPQSMLSRPTGKPSMGVKEIPSPEKESESKCYRLPSGQLYIPAAAFKGALMGAVSGQKFGKKAARPVFAASVFEKGEHCLLYSANGEAIKEFEIDVRRAVVQRQGVARARAKVQAPWHCEVTFEFVSQIMDAGKIEDGLAQAGALVGVLDFRPQKLGPFGRFKVNRVWPSLRDV